MLARIAMSAECVTWSDFQQPCRTGRGKSPVWDYSHFGPFVFERAEYEEALRQAAESRPALTLITMTIAHFSPCPCVLIYLVISDPLLRTENRLMNRGTSIRISLVGLLQIEYNAPLGGN